MNATPRKYLWVLAALGVVFGGYKMLSAPPTPKATPAEVTCRPLLEKWNAKVRQMVKEDSDADLRDSKDSMQSLDTMMRDFRAYQRREALREYRRKLQAIDREAAYDELRAAEWNEWRSCLESQGVDLASVKPESMQSRGVRLGLIEPTKRKPVPLED